MPPLGNDVIAGPDRQSLKPSKFSNFRRNTIKTKPRKFLSNFFGFISKPFSGVPGSQKHRLPSTPTCHTALPEQDRRAWWSAQMTTGHQRDRMVYYQQYSDRTNIITPKRDPPTSPISNNLSPCNQARAFQHYPCQFPLVAKLLSRQNKAECFSNM